MSGRPIQVPADPQREAAQTALAKSTGGRILNRLNLTFNPDRDGEHDIGPIIVSASAAIGPSCDAS